MPSGSVTVICTVFSLSKASRLLYSGSAAAVTNSSQAGVHGNRIRPQTEEVYRTAIRPAARVKTLLRGIVAGISATISNDFFLLVDGVAESATSELSLDSLPDP